MRKEILENKNEIITILINKTMEKKKQKKNYSAPNCVIVQVNETTNLMAGSPFNGQHNPAQPGGTSGDAKKAFDWMDEDEDENEEETPSWKD